MRYALSREIEMARVFDQWRRAELYICMREKSHMAVCRVVDEPTSLRIAGPSAGPAGVSVIRHFRDVEALLPEWIELFYESGTPNPFAHPHWMLAWARHYVADDELFVVTVRDDAGRLVGLAPFYLARRHLMRSVSVSQLRLFGIGRHGVPLTELPQILTYSDPQRKILRAIMGVVCEHRDEWDWVRVSLTPTQGWFEPQWIPESQSDDSIFVLHRGVRPHVVLSLPDTWGELRSGLKRNVKESIRRGSNRLTRDGLAPQFEVPNDPASVDAAIDELSALHKKRASAAGKVRHADYLFDARDRAFLRDAVCHMAAAGHVSPHLMRVGDATVAGRLVLHANDTTFFSVSGFDPAWWEYSVATTLTVNCLQAAIARGDTLADLSQGPEVAKLRWSEELVFHRDFFIVAPGRRSRAVFAAYWLQQSLERLRQESRWYRNRRQEGE